jgi:hypothetical protein
LARRQLTRNEVGATDRAADNAKGSALMPAGLRLTDLQRRADAVLGPKRATIWMHRPHRQLSGLTPYELAETSDAGLRIAARALETLPRETVARGPR